VETSFWTLRYASKDASFRVIRRGRDGEILFTDATGRYSIPIELSFARGTNYWATLAIDIETGRWVVGNAAFRILEKINEGFMECDGLRMSTKPGDFSSMKSPKARFLVNEHEVTFEEWKAHRESEMPKDGEQSPYYGSSGRTLLG
jgi:hypothetical protein